MRFSPLSGKKSTKVRASTCPRKSSRSAVPTKAQRCQDAPFLILYLAFAAYFLSVVVFVMRYCTLAHFWLGVDSWGNVCGSGNRSPQSIDGVPGSGTMKVEFPYVWKTTFALSCNQTATVEGVASLRICVMVCPNVTAGPPVCTRVIQQNGYDTLPLARQECQAIEMKVEAEDCPVRWPSDIRSPQAIMNRCMDSLLLSSGYVEIQGYVVILNYAVNDIINTVAKTGSLVGVVTVACILAGLVCAKFPKHATISCYIFGITMATLSCVWLGLLVANSSIQPPSTLNSAVRTVVSSVVPIGMVLVLYGAVVVVESSYNIYNDMNHRKGIVRKGIWRSAALCIIENPKILSQPIITVCASAVSSFFFGLLALTVYSCGEIKKSSTTSTAEVQLGTMNWLVLICVLGNIWLVALMRRGQDAMLAGAVAEWYYRKPKHPLTTSLKSLLKRNLGSLAVTSLRGIGLNKVIAFTCRSDKAAFVLPYLSAFSTVSIGIYGEVRTLCLTEQVSQDTITQKVQREFIVARNSLKAVRAGAVICSVCLFIFFTKVHMNVALAPIAMLVFTSWYVTGAFCDAAVITMGSIGVCVMEDFKNNDGDKFPYFCRNDIALYLGIAIPKSATYEGRERMRKIEGQIAKMRAKASLVFRKYSDIEKIATKSSGNSETEKMEEISEQNLGSVRSERKLSENDSVGKLSSEEDQNIGMHFDTPSKHEVGNGPSKRAISSSSISPVGVQDDVAEDDISVELQPFPIEAVMRHQDIIESELPTHRPGDRLRCTSPASIQRELAVEGSADDCTDCPSPKESTAATTDRETNLKVSSNLATFDNSKSIGRWKRLTIAAAKSVAPQWIENKKQTKIIPTVRKEESCNAGEWDDWW